MNAHTLSVILDILLAAGGVFALMGLYYIAIALFGLKRARRLPQAAPRTRFAVFVAARNEEAVVGHLVDSLQAQRYPRELYDIYVAPNNCTDATREVALARGARIFDAEGPITGKGEVLRQFSRRLTAGEEYDALLVFDADNLVHPDFLQRMNDARLAGAAVAQGFRDSKNPADTAVATCYSVCYWMLNRFYNGGREALGLSALVGGSGFMVDTALLRRLGGFDTHTMTEDYEFSAQCVLAGEKVRYVADAVIYDEQPLTFFQSWRQRRRWSTGSVQSMNAHLAALMKAALRRRSWVCADMAITFMGPLVQFVSLVMGAVSMALSVWQLLMLGLVPLALVAAAACAGLLAAFLMCSALAAFVIWLNRGKVAPGSLRGVFAFAFFLVSWLPIGVISLFKPQKTWHAIAHTHVASLQDMPRHNAA